VPSSESAPSGETAALSDASSAATRYTRTSGPLDVSKFVKRKTRRPSSSRWIAAVPMLLWATLWKLPVASTAAAGVAEPVTEAGEAATGRLSLTCALTQSRSGRNRAHARVPIARRTMTPALRL
jgi:hypothetical protein